MTFHTYPVRGPVRRIKTKLEGGGPTSLWAPGRCGARWRTDRIGMVTLTLAHDPQDRMVL